MEIVRTTLEFEQAQLHQKMRAEVERQQAAGASAAQIEEAQAAVQVEIDAKRQQAAAEFKELQVRGHIIGHARNNM